MAEQRTQTGTGQSCARMPEPSGAGAFPARPQSEGGGHEKRPLISVIIPVYNIPDCIERCVRSVCAQTYQRLEILLVDDGSTDQTGAICDALALKDGRIRVYHKPNGGSSSARNLGIDQARGEYLGFVDSDDWIEPQMYEKLLTALTDQEEGEPARGEAVPAEAGGSVEWMDHAGDIQTSSGDKSRRQSPARIAQISRDEIDADGHRREDVCKPPKQRVVMESGQFLRTLLMHEGDCSFCTKLLPRDLLGDKRFPEGELNEDFKLLISLLGEAGAVCILPEQLYHVYYRIGSNTRKKDAGDFSRVFEDIVRNADAAAELVAERYPWLSAESERFGLYQRLDYLLHIPVERMRREDAFYSGVVSYCRRHLARGMKNPFLTGKQKGYLLLLSIAPKTVRRAHRVWMRLRDARRTKAASLQSP